MTPSERHAQDARIQSAALRHFASKCRLEVSGAGTNKADAAQTEQLLEWAIRADALADTYERLEIATMLAAP